MTHSPPSPSDGNNRPSPSDTDADDRALMARIARGDRSALEQLFRRHAHWLTARLEYRCGDPELADIALQDTFVAVWRSAKKYRAQGTVGAWLWGIAIRRLIDQLRKRRPIPMPIEHLDSTGRRAGSITFEDQLTQQAAFSELGPALQQLNPDLRAVLIATAIDGLTTNEAAQLLGIPQGTVKTRLMRARHELQEALS